MSGLGPAKKERKSHKLIWETRLLQTSFSSDFLLRRLRPLPIAPDPKAMARITIWPEVRILCDKKSFGEIARLSSVFNWNSENLGKKVAHFRIKEILLTNKKQGECITRSVQVHAGLVRKFERWVLTIWRRRCLDLYSCMTFRFSFLISFLWRYNLLKE